MIKFVILNSQTTSGENYYYLEYVNIEGRGRSYALHS